MQHVFSISRTKNYVNFKKDNSVDVEPPVLISPSNTPIGSGIGTNSNTSNGGVVNVVNDFYWTYSKLKESRQEVPRIILTEKRLKSNALISQLKYSFGVVKSNGQALINKLPNNISKGLNSFISKTYSAAVNSDAGQAVRDYYNSIPGFQDTNDVYENNPYLLPYQNLYITEPTGWQFIMPYFTNYNNSQANTFSNDSGGGAFLGLLQQGANMVTDWAEMLSVLNNPTQITFVEKAKFYNYPTEGDSFSFSFPLINTGSASFDDVIRNWELLFLILYNNKPSRKNVSVIDPPVIYQVEIPGVKFLPFCYISDLAVEFQGSRRELSFGLSVTDSLNVDASIPVAGPTLNPQQTLETVVRGFSNVATPRNVTTIVPDAYNIRITVKSLLPESKNFMYSVLNKNNIVTTNTLGAGINDVLNPFLREASANSSAAGQNPLDTNATAPGLPTP
jgi:hypothetical protein